MTARLQRLKRIYDEALSWSEDRSAVRRVLAAINPRARLVLVGEALGPKTVRLSGINYFDCDGNLGATSRYLERLLGHLGYTLFPPRDVKVPNGTIRAGVREGRQTAYCTDICPMFPGYDAARKRHKIRRPKSAIIRAAIKRRFLERELGIVKPQVIILLGSHAYKFFYRHFLNRPIPFSLSETVKKIGKIDLPTYNGAVVVPFFHPSPANLRSVRWFKSFPNSAECRRFLKRVRPLCASGR